MMDAADRARRFASRSTQPRDAADFGLEDFHSETTVFAIDVAPPVAPARKLAAVLRPVSPRERLSRARKWWSAAASRVFYKGLVLVVVIGAGVAATSLSQLSRSTPAPLSTPPGPARPEIAGALRIVAVTAPLRSGPREERPSIAEPTADRESVPRSRGIGKPQAIEVPTNAARQAERGADDQRVILGVLRGYRDAFSTLDVRAVAAVWPTADVTTLRRRFASIDDQNLEFEQCRVSIADVNANASCSGVVESGLRAGQRRLRSTRTHWQFTLEKIGGRWLIRSASPLS